MKFCGECGIQLIPLRPGYPPGAEDQIAVTKTLETSTDGLLRGTLFAGRYEIIEELGAGGMGRVYRVQDTKLNEEIALKLIKPEIAGEKRTVERFRNEIKTARKITHKNICRTHDLGEEGKKLFITMEYVRGEDLKSVIRRMRLLAPGTAVSIVRQVAEGLAEAHRLGVVHRDLKPANIMIDKDGNAKIMDFGIARSLARAGTTAEGAVIGTPEYMSPEQVDGKPADQRADIYALGVILFEMVTGRPPFEGDTSLAVAHKHKYEPAADPRTLNPQLPIALGRLILRSMEKEREKRFQTAAELLSDLEAVEAALPTAERIPGRAPSRTRPPTSKTITVKMTPRMLLIPSAALLAIIAAVIIWQPWDRGDKSTRARTIENSIAVLPFTDLSPEKNQAALCEGIADTILNTLANVKALQVRGRHSSFKFTAQDDPREVGRKLNVSRLLSGSLQILGDRIRITFQLVKTADGAPEWSGKRDGGKGEIFDIQDMIAAAVVSRMNLELAAAEATGLKKRYTNNKEAYDLYLKGRYIERSVAAEDIQKAIPVYLEAIGKDPNFALPYIALALDYTALGTDFGYVLPWDEAHKKSMEAVSRALAIDDENGVAFAVLANINQRFENDLAAADRNFERAIRLSLQDPGVLEHHSVYLTSRGRLAEALEEIKLMVEIDPLLPQNYFYLGRQYYYLHRYGDSIAAYAKGLELEPDHLNSLAWRNFTFLAQGRHDKVFETVKHLEKIWPPGVNFWLAMDAASNGNRTEAERYMEEAKVINDDPFNSAFFYAALGDRGSALSCLKRLFDKSPSGVGFCFMIHFFDKYRSDPDFVELARKSGFEF